MIKCSEFKCCSSAHISDVKMGIWGCAVLGLKGMGSEMKLQSNLSK